MTKKDFQKKYIQIFKGSQYAFRNVEELISQQMNRSKGWKCMAGIHNLYIDYDGNVFVCNNASSKLDRFNHEAWASEIKRIKEKENLDICSDENLKNGVFKERLRKFNRSGKAFKRELDANEPESFKQHWGFLGNIRQGFSLNDKVVTCPYDTCGCGADIPIPKARDLATLNQMTNEDIVEDMDQVANQAIQEPEGYRIGHYPQATVLWDLGRRCNYDCSYCWPAVHNAREEHKDIEMLISTCQKIMEALSPGQVKTFCFSGGEPTLHPAIIELTRFIQKSGHRVLMTSNGSMKSEKWQNLVPYIDILQLSGHFEFLNQERFLRNLEIYLHKGIGGVDVKLMTPPGGVEKSHEFRLRIIELIRKPENAEVNGRNRVKVSFVPLRGLEDSENMLEYTEEELQFFSNQ